LGLRYNTLVTDSDEFWDFYWETSQHKLADLGKWEAIRAASRLARRLAGDPLQPVRILELGCGEGQVIGALLRAHAGLRAIQTSCGVDYSPTAIEKGRRAFPELTFIEGDITDPELGASLGQFEIVLLVNALHEVFSSAYSQELGEVDISYARRRVEEALAGAVARLAPGGFLLLFDGLESEGDTSQILRIRWRDRPARRRFETFASEYRPFHIAYYETGDSLRVDLSYRDFTRYVTKLIFLDRSLWQTERLESYQYFTQAEFVAAFERLGLEICEISTLTVDYEKWRAEVEIETEGVDYPTEHILMIGRKAR
jgi:SAM-dependent methyltransferase